MNKATRELLDRKKEENRLKEEAKLNKKLKKEEKQEKKNTKSEKVVKTVVKETKTKKIVKTKIQEDEVKNIQNNYDELKKQSDRTERFIRLADELKIDDKDVPKTEKGMNTKAKEILDRLNRKLEKEEKKK